MDRIRTWNGAKDDSREIRLNDPIVEGTRRAGVQYSECGANSTQEKADHMAVDKNVDSSKNVDSAVCVCLRLCAVRMRMQGKARICAVLVTALVELLLETKRKQSISFLLALALQRICYRHGLRGQRGL